MHQQGEEEEVEEGLTIKTTDNKYLVGQAFKVKKVVWQPLNNKYVFLSKLHAKFGSAF